jgi:two-component system, NtrC family, response regulator HydG
VGADPLIMGRSIGCDIVLADPIVSRRHCQIVVSDGKVFFTDLGARNPVLHNGQPEPEGELAPGDELAIGPELFVLAHAPAFLSGPVLPGEEMEAILSPSREYQETLDGMLYLDEEAARPVPPHRPRTLHDLARLYGATREFSACDTSDALEKTLVSIVRERFQPEDVWFAYTHGGDDLDFVKTGKDTAQTQTAPPVKAIREALCSGKGLLSRHGLKSRAGETVESVMVAPMAVSGMSIAVVAVRASLSGQTPFSRDDLAFLVMLASSLAPFLHAVERVSQLRRDNERLRTRSGEDLVLVGDSRAIRHVRAMTARAAASDLHVLVVGETGTGKELVARLVHAQSRRGPGPFVVVNCAAIPGELFESVLFGHMKGSFTGAFRDTVGLMAQADGGTLFLDEVGDLSIENQARILRAIEYGTYRRIGDEQENHADIRVVAATNKPIAPAIANGAFRADLFHRISGFELVIPPLRERPSDIPILAQHFIDLFRASASRPIGGISLKAQEYLERRSWGGNIRELRNCIQRAVSLAKSDELQLADVMGNGDATPQPAPDGAVLTLADMEKRHITQMLRRCGGNVRDTAQALGIGRSTLYKKIGDYGIEL